MALSLLRTRLIPMRNSLFCFLCPANRLIIILLCTIALSGCGEGRFGKLVPTDLSDKGIPVIFDAPEGASVTAGIPATAAGAITMSSVIVKKDTFNVEVIQMACDARSLEEIVAGIRKGSREIDVHQGFEIETEHGHVQRIRLQGKDEYLFNYALKKGNAAIVFMPGAGQVSLTKDQAMEIFEALETAH